MIWMKIAIILGTRPEIIKMSPVIDEIQKRGSEFIIIHTGQHYDTQMSEQFFIDLDLPKPDYNILAGSKSAIQQISTITDKLDEILTSEEVDIVLVQGDTNAVLSGALAANKLNIPVGHIEAGLRSFDKNMPEEINRLVADECTRMYFVPTDKTAINLLAEGINHHDIYITGNTIVDACKRNIHIAHAKSNILSKIKFDEYITLTLHRAENVDDDDRLKNIVESLINLPYNIVFPLHPHTRNSLEKIGMLNKVLETPHIQVTMPLGYLDFLDLMSHSKLLLTDSGGIQEEAITLDIPCVTLRYNTERPETIDAGGNILAGTLEEEITSNIKNILDNPEVYKKMSEAPNPYGNGNSAKLICDAIDDLYKKDDLKIQPSNRILDFKGYHLETIKEDIIVSEFESSTRFVQQVFAGSDAIYFNDNTNLNGMTIIVKEFK